MSNKRLYNLSDNEITDAKSLSRSFYRSAVEYFVAYTVLTVNPVVNFEGVATHIILPPFTNGAFACELFLKSLYYHYEDKEVKKMRREHDLLKLFNILPAAARTSIVDYVSNKTEQIYNYTNFTDHLRVISKTFVESRYACERIESAFYEGLLCCLCDALYQECTKIHAILD